MHLFDVKVGASPFRKNQPHSRPDDPDFTAAMPSEVSSNFPCEYLYTSLVVISKAIRYKSEYHGYFSFGSNMKRRSVEPIHSGVAMWQLSSVKVAIHSQSKILWLFALCAKIQMFAQYHFPSFFTLRANKTRECHQGTTNYENIQTQTLLVCSASARVSG
jgi:hypothetical protein